MYSCKGIYSIEIYYRKNNDDGERKKEKKTNEIEWEYEKKKEKSKESNEKRTKPNISLVYSTIIVCIVVSGAFLCLYSLYRFFFSFITEIMSFLFHLPHFQWQSSYFKRRFSWYSLSHFEMRTLRFLVNGATRAVQFIVKLYSSVC